MDEQTIGTAPTGETHRADPPQAAAEPRARSGAIWPFVIVGLLALNIGVCAVTIFAAVTTRPLVESDYYERSLNWSAEDAAWPAPERHGWVVAVEVAGTDLLVRINASDGRPVEFDELLAATHGTTAPVSLSHEGSGVFRAAGLFASAEPGAVELRLRAAGGQQARMARDLARPID